MTDVKFRFFFFFLLKSLKPASFPSILHEPMVSRSFITCSATQTSGALGTSYKFVMIFTSPKQPDRMLEYELFSPYFERENLPEDLYR